ncbi:hypothetical protein LCGC14_0619360 [marine sediment metagenome]|uniref:Uncharacterized protein n=1 Tax=marine sediment metagenome TaxID=412755 RepID=A0A0F9RA94_9ZZZZ|nr:hypothetical protein [Actinomycetota bacterium]
MENINKQLERRGLTIGFVDGDTLAEMNLVGTAYESRHKEQAECAQRLVTCWNEHDTLKAKEKLLDEFIADLEVIVTKPGLPHNEVVRRTTTLANDYREIK